MLRTKRQLSLMKRRWIYLRALASGNRLILIACLAVYHSAATGQDVAQPMPAVALKAAAAQERTPIPDRAALDAAEQAYEQAFRNEVQKATTPAKTLELAKRMQRMAGEASERSAESYVLYIHARQLAVKASDVEAALAITDQFIERFAVDKLTDVYTTLVDLSKVGIPPAATKPVATRATALIDAAIKEDRFAVAENSLSLAKAMAGRAGNKRQLAQLNATAADLKLLAQAYEKLKPALASLAKHPNDAEASFAVGRYRCFLKGEWDRGLNLLATGSDEPLRNLAKQDLASPNDAEKQMAVADSWWALAEKENGRSRNHLRQRAAQWYASASSNLTGLAKAKAENRLKEVALTAFSVDDKAPATYLTELKAESIRILGLRNGQIAAPPELALRIARDAFVLGGRKSERGLKAHPPSARSSSHYAYQLAKGFAVLSGSVGVIDGLEANPASPLTFRIVGDGKPLWQSNPITKSGEATEFDVDVRGVERLELYADCAGSNLYAHGVWFDPLLRKAAERRAPPQAKDSSFPAAVARFSFEPGDRLVNKNGMGPATSLQVEGMVTYTESNDRDAPPAALGSGIRFADGRQRESLAIDKSLFKSPKWSLSMWFRRAEAKNQDYLLYLGELNGSPGGCPALNLLLGPDGVLRAFNYQSFRTNSKDLDASVANVRSGEWHYLVVTFETADDPTHQPGGLRVYLDGNEAIGHDKTNIGLSLRNSKSGFMLGSLKRPGEAWDRTFNGVIADVRLFDQVLKATDVKGEWQRLVNAAKR